MRVSSPRRAPSRPRDEREPSATEADQLAPTPTAVIEVVALRSFEDMYRAEYPCLVGLAYLLTGRRDVAEELVQEAMLRAYRHWSDVSSLDRPGAWVRRVLLNLAASRWRRQRAAAKAHLHLAPPEERAEPSAETIAIWSAVRRLPRRQAEVVTLYYGADMPVSEVAEVLDCAPGTVRAHLARARRSLAVSLREDPDAEQDLR
jgi:RNA polymerase sigma-70 factor, ECF subfamily